ncbi:MAG: YbjQ family protein [Acidimicrobiales bacterium]|nr:YbjQ family protein [Acidimicrobiales bacterium]|tara:strand:- start:2752 stop:3051 length:300 start_codon:yes stop_codon:yes gene_type:complete
MDLFTIENIGGTPLGMVTGSTIKTKDIVKDIGAGLKGLVGGKLGSYEKLMEEARAEATSKMIRQAEALGANAIVGVRYESTEVMAGAAEILVFGTAVSR